jgi:hypothetical protein
MYFATQSSDQLHTIFGGGFVLEHHGNETHRCLPPLESRAFGVAAAWLGFYAIAVASVGVATFGKVIKVATAAL